MNGTDDRDLHTHECFTCHAIWRCENPNCLNDNICGRCEAELMDDWAQTREPHTLLPEPKEGF